MDLGFGIFFLVVLLILFITAVAASILLIKKRDPNAIQTVIFAAFSLVFCFILICFIIHDASQPTYKDYKVTALLGFIHTIIVLSGIMLFTNIKRN